ncbi:MAG: imidazole glycerol phosphate synthase subunit HisH [Thermoflexales bacterium]
MIAVIDYGAGNLRNVCKALDRVGANLTLTADPREIERADKVVLPGVGAFADCMMGLQQRNLIEPCLEAAHSGRPFLGICVGMQLLFDVGEEMGEWPGLGLIPGRVGRFDFTKIAGETRLPIPHIGWNHVLLDQPDHPLVAGVSPTGYAYFVHSYHARGMPPANVVASTEYGYAFPAVVARNNVFGIQFHPEKSQAVGLQMLRNFVTL